MLGKVISYQNSKNFGFLKGEDGKRYFFHKDDWLVLSNPKNGMLINFEVKNEKKGLKAIGIKEASGVGNKSVTYKSYTEPRDFVFVKDEKPKYGELLHSSKEIMCESSDSPDKAKLILKNKIINAGGNAVINFKYSKRTGASGNYNYSIHQFSGCPAYILEKKKVKNKNDVRDKDSFKENLENFQEKSKLLISEIEENSVSDFFKALLTVLGIIIFAIFIF